MITWDANNKTVYPLVSLNKPLLNPDFCGGVLGWVDFKVDLFLRIIYDPVLHLDYSNLLKAHPQFVHW